jgi:beta-lactamase class A
MKFGGSKAFKLVILGASAMAFSSCSFSEPAEKTEIVTEGYEALADIKVPAWEAVAAIEKRIGGRIGAVLIDERRRVIAGHRAQERFAMCSTFKLPLVGAILDKVESKDIKLDQLVRFTKADMVNNSPVVEAALAKGTLSVSELAAGTMRTSDNAAANLLLKLVDGPAGLTRMFKEWEVSDMQVDRYEPFMNSNLEKDLRDTTTPLAMAVVTRRLTRGDILKEKSRDLLVDWMKAAETGKDRIRGGLPKDWVAGDKTGTCGTAENNTAYNDVAIFFPPREISWKGDRDTAARILALYVDKSAASEKDIKAAMAEIGALAAKM